MTPFCLDRMAEDECTKLENMPNEMFISGRDYKFKSTVDKNVHASQISGDGHMRQGRNADGGRRHNLLRQTLICHGQPTLLHLFTGPTVAKLTSGNIRAGPCFQWQKLINFE